MGLLNKRCQPITNCEGIPLSVILAANPGIIIGQVVFVPAPGVDLGDMTINNGGGGAAVNIQDGGNAITIDGAVTAALTGPLGQAAMAASLPVTMASDQSAIPVKLPGALVTLLAATVITTDATTNYAAVTGLDIYSRAAIALVVSGKAMDALTTLNIWIQRSLNGGATWDDVGAFSQLTSALIPDGIYVMDLLLTGSSQIDRVQRDGTLTANTVATVASFGDRLRVKKISVNFAGGDTVTIALKAYMIP